MPSTVAVTPEAELDGITEADVLDEIVDSLGAPLPTDDMSSRWRLTSSGTALGVGVGSLLALGVIARYDELIVFAAAGALLLGLAFIVPRHLADNDRAHGGAAHGRARDHRPDRPPGQRRWRRAACAHHRPAGGCSCRSTSRRSTSRPVHVPAASRPAGEVTARSAALQEQRSVHACVRTTERDVRDDIIVHPVVHNLKPGRWGAPAERNTMMSRISQDPLADFRALRASVRRRPRNVHWASTARTGRLVVKDHSRMRKSMRLVVLETLDRTITAPLFEEAVEIAASIVIDAVTEGISVTARTRDAAHAGRLESITGRREALELFARVQRTESLSTLGADRVRPLGQDIDQVFLIAGGSSPLIDGFATNVWVRHRLVVIRVSERPAELRKLPCARSMFATPRSSSAGGAWDWSREDRPPRQGRPRGMRAAAVGVTAYQIERVFEPEYSQWTIADPGALPRGRAAHDRPMVAAANRRSHRGRDRSDDVRHSRRRRRCSGDLARSIVGADRHAFDTMARARAGDSRRRVCAAVAVAGACRNLALARRFAVHR